ncbi:hypothetical protein M9Y10_042891 [Tritrichomonas musculus]|uniref:USP domain-containing protein n=1 Tax=Tritrichomonas musculus TaxID=1915356 RepID=A0ABR2JY54_9EUKA
MAQCSQHILDTNFVAKQLYFSLTLSKVFVSEILNENLSKLTICTKCNCLCYQGESMREHFKDTRQEHSLFLGLCPMRIICIKCGHIFGCPAALMKSIIYSLPSYPTETPPIGFYNLGNSCYSNSVLIALSHCHPLVIASSSSSLLHLKVFNIAATANRQFNQIFHAINPKFSPFVQEDAAEFLLYVLDIFSNDPNCKSLFNGSTKTHFLCTKCKHHSENEQSFTVLGVPLNHEGWKGKKRNVPSQYLARDYGKGPQFGEPGDGSFENHVVSFVQHFSVSSISLENSLQSLFSPHFEISNGKVTNKKNEPLTKCEKCKGDVQMVTTLERLPEVLIIHLERFGKRWFGLGKMYQNVSFPEDDADFSQFMPPTVESGPSLYSLVAVVIHNGFMSSGHYMCYARKFGSKQWYLFNDNEVTAVSRDEVLNSQAYILFYQKKPPMRVVEIRSRITKSMEPFWAAIPIKIFSDARMWRKSIPVFRLKHKTVENQKENQKSDNYNLNEANSNTNQTKDTNNDNINNKITNKNNNDNENSNININDDDNNNNGNDNNNDNNNNNNNVNDNNNDNNNNDNNNNDNNNNDNNNNNNDNNNNNNDNNNNNNNNNNNDNNNNNNVNDNNNDNNNNNNDNNNNNNENDSDSNELVSEVYANLAPILNDASKIAGERVEREETEQDVRTRLVTLYPYSKSKICITNSSAEMLWEFVAQKGPIPFMVRAKPNAMNCQAIGDEAEFLITDIEADITQQAEGKSTQDRNEQVQSTQEENKQKQNNQIDKTQEEDGQTENKQEGNNQIENRQAQND